MTRRVKLGGVVGSWFRRICSQMCIELDGAIDYTHPRRTCRYRAESSLETLVWTRGAALGRGFEPKS